MKSPTVSQTGDLDWVMHQSVESRHNSIGTGILEVVQKQIKCRRPLVWIGSGLIVLKQGLTRLALEFRKYVRSKKVSQTGAVDWIRPQDVCDGG